MGKGQQFERQIAKDLSLWFTHGERDDVFWRTAGSGARATVRAQAGIDTENQKGDIAGTVSESAKWLKGSVIELKNGYGKILLHSVLQDKSNISRWFEKVRKESLSWMLIHRDRVSLVFMSDRFFYEKIDVIRTFSLFTIGNRFGTCFVMFYKDFLNCTKPRGV